MLTVVPARLAEAFPELDVSTVVGLHPLSAAGAADGTVAGFSPLDFSFGNDFFRCGLPVTTGYSFSMHSSFSADATVDLHFPLFHQPHGTISVTLSGSTSFAFAIPAGVHCDGTANLPPLVGVVGGIPVYVQVGVTGSAQVAQDWNVTANAGLTLTAGMSFQGLHVSPIFTLHPHGSASTHGAGKISVGPNLRLAIGVPAGIDAHLDLNPADSFTVGSGVCAFAIDDNVQGGVTFGPFEVNEPATIASLPVYDCRAPSVTVISPGSQTGTLGTPTSLQIQASDTDGGGLTYAATGLPAGLTINRSTGLISGTPTTAETTSVTVTATDSTGPNGSTAFGWTITAPATYTTGDIMASTGNGQVSEFAPDGTLMRVLDTGTASEFTAGSAFDSSGDFYVSDFDGGTVTKFDPNGNLIGTFGSGYAEAPESIAINGSGDAFVGQANPDSTTGICADCNVLEFDAAGNNIGSFAASPEDRGTDWIALAPDGCTLYYTSEGTSVEAFDLCTDQQLPDFADNLPGSAAYQFRLLPGGGMLVADSEVVVQLDSSGNVVQEYSDPAESLLFALDLTPDGSAMWVGDASTGDIIEWDLSSGNELASFNAAPASDVGGITVVGAEGSLFTGSQTTARPAAANPRGDRRHPASSIGRVSGPDAAETPARPARSRGVDNRRAVAPPISRPPRTRPRSR